MSEDTTYYFSPSIAPNNQVLAWMNNGGTSLAIGLSLFFLLTAHWGCLLYLKVKDKVIEEMVLLQRKIWIILMIQTVAMMQTSTFAAVWVWLTLIPWIG